MRGKGTNGRARKRAKNREAKAKAKTGDGKLPSHFVNDKETVQDAQLIARAIKERWPIREDLRQPLINRMIAIALSKESSSGHAIAAARAVIAADAANQKDQHLEQPLQVQHAHAHAHLHAGIDGADDGPTIEQKRQAVRTLIRMEIMRREAAGETEDGETEDGEPAT